MSAEGEHEGGVTAEIRTVADEWKTVIENEEDIDESDGQGSTVHMERTLKPQVHRNLR